MTTIFVKRFLFGAALVLLLGAQGAWAMMAPERPLGGFGSAIEKLIERQHKGEALSDAEAYKVQEYIADASEYDWLNKRISLACSKYNPGNLAIDLPPSCEKELPLKLSREEVDKAKARMHLLDEKWSKQ